MGNLAAGHGRVLFFCAWAYAQDVAPAFEAASVKVKMGFSNPDRLRATNTTLHQLIQAACDIDTDLLFGTTAWMESEPFDSDAKQPGTPVSRKIW